MSGHVPVMLDEVLEALSPRDGARYIDGTFGGGGYTRAILEAADCRVLGIDRDPDAVARGQALVAHFGGRLTLVQGEFSRMDEIADGLSDGVVLDLGVSSFQFDEAERGFSFRADGPLDMRMSKDGESAADFVNSADEKTLIHVLSYYGEEHRARIVRPPHPPGWSTKAPRRPVPPDPYIPVSGVWLGQPGIADPPIRALW